MLTCAASLPTWRASFLRNVACVAARCQNAAFFFWTLVLSVVFDTFNVRGINPLALREVTRMLRILERLRGSCAFQTVARWPQQCRVMFGGSVLVVVFFVCPIVGN
eukprot:TRINITY_DN3311_c0_g5_i1.p1 TRINITY_DN3311_c0_g5~~TRINITY_DN3311_c0_g5_i1.p1  ORF type:complete len:106 (+),score=6.10 TRINITY_DN3311_c0_g5_i1:164-481(+)